MPIGIPNTMNLLSPLLAVGLGWVLGVAVQLQQPALWPLAAYGSALAAGVALALLAWLAPRWRGWPLWLAAGLLVGAGLTGSRAAIGAAHALPAAMEGRDITVTGRIASLPQSTAMGLRFGLVVDSARLDGQPVMLPERLQLSWFAGARNNGIEPPALQAGGRWQPTGRLRQPPRHRHPPRHGKAAQHPHARLVDASQQRQNRLHPLAHFAAMPHRLTVHLGAVIGLAPRQIAAGAEGARATAGQPQRLERIIVAKCCQRRL